MAITIVVHLVIVVGTVRSIGLWCCVVVFPTFSRAFTQLSLCIEFLAIAFLVRAGLG